MKTSELTGAALDWAVAKCEGDNSVASCYYSDDNVPLCLEEAPEPLWEPSTDWAQGGPIIEREELCIDKVARENWCACVRSVKNSPWLYGPTPLIAAMRCYVASKLGDTVEIPDELAKG
jgi:hypothetical protein